jgi:methylenetetrahydrofolate reductase (NADPH)
LAEERLRGSGAFLRDLRGLRGAEGREAFVPAMIAQPAPLTEEDLFAAIRRLMAGASLEVAPRDLMAGPALRYLFEPPAEVFINFAPGETHHGIVAAAVRLAASGFTPVPHVAARCIASFSQLNDYLARVAGEAGVTAALVVAGDPDRPVGAYSSSLDLIETGLFEKHGIRRVMVAGYPEGHPKLSRPALAAALAAKVAAAQRRGLDLGIVTQFGFAAAPILAWIMALRAHAIAAPVRVGLAGPASIATLAKFAVRCGIGNAVGALIGGHTAVARLLTETGPERVIADLAVAAGPAAPDGLHFYAFGGVARTAAWLSTAAQGRFALAAGAADFRVQL